MRARGAEITSRRGSWGGLRCLEIILQPRRWFRYRACVRTCVGRIGRRGGGREEGERRHELFLSLASAGRVQLYKNPPPPAIESAFFPLLHSIHRTRFGQLLFLFSPLFSFFFLRFFLSLLATLPSLSIQNGCAVLLVDTHPVLLPSFFLHHFSPSSRNITHQNKQCLTAQTPRQLKAPQNTHTHTHSNAVLPPYQLRRQPVHQYASPCPRQLSPSPSPPLTWRKQSRSTSSR